MCYRERVGRECIHCSPRSQTHCSPSSLSSLAPPDPGLMTTCVEGMCVKKIVNRKTKAISGGVLRRGLSSTSRSRHHKDPSILSLLFCDPKARKRSLDLDDFPNSLHEHATLLGRKLLVLSLSMLDRAHDRRLRFARLFSQENSLFHHGLICGSPEIKWSSVEMPIVLGVSRSRGPSLMGVL